MSEPFLSEIKIVSFDFPPRGWAQCNGQLLPINQNQALFALLETTYGGDGITNFALPDFRGRAPIHFGNGHNLGERAGEEAHTLTQAELPGHTHVLNGSTANATANTPGTASDKVYARGSFAVYSNQISNLVPMNAGAVLPAGGSQAHDNMMPFLPLNFIIALQGIFPSRN